MKRLLILCLLLCISISYANPVKLKRTEARLISALSETDGRSSIWMLFHLKIDPGWHTYWQNPGDSGLPPNIKLTMPQGFHQSNIIWQAPHRIPLGPLMNFGYEDNAYHLFVITPPKEGFNKTYLPIQADIEWVVCEEECIPEEAHFELNIPIGEKNRPSEDFQFIQTLISRSTTVLPEITGRISGKDQLTVTIEKSDIPNAERLESVYFYPEQTGLTEPAAKQELRRDGERLKLIIQGGTAPITGQLHGLLELTDKHDKTYYRIRLNAADAAPIQNTEHQSLWIILFFALLGGIILNAMPCVFPVLSIKILHLLKITKRQRKDLVLFGASYAAGVIVSFTIIGLILILLKQAGAHIGWGYQMQSPTFVACLIYLLFLIGLSLSGFFDITMTANFGHKTASREDLIGNFVTGCLVTLVATPCTAPFMGIAVGAAITQSAPIAMLIFLFVGMGLALPFLLFTLIPGTYDYLPKPGLWMVQLKEFLAFPMYLSVIWLLWVFMQQMNIAATILILFGLLLTTFNIWFWKQTHVTGPTRFGLAVLLILISVAPITQLSTDHYGVAAHTVKGEKFSEAKLVKLVQTGQPVFVYATAAWCITCKVNEKIAIHTAIVQRAFKEKSIQVVAIDWTNRDADIAQYLYRFGRSGVPLTVLYPGGNAKPIILPQLLTPSIILQYLDEHVVK